MGAHPISSSLSLVIALALFVGCASEDLSVLNPAIAVCRGADGEACGDNFELGALAVGRTHEQTLYIRNVGAGYLDIRRASFMVSSQVLPCLTVCLTWLFFLFVFFCLAHLKIKYWKNGVG